MEENYRLIKKIGLTNFRGYSKNSVLQEFWIAMILANLALAIKRATDGRINSTLNQKETGIDIRRTGMISSDICSVIWGEYMDTETPAQKLGVISYIFDFAISHRVQDKTSGGESILRPVPRNVKHHYKNMTIH